MDKDSFTGAHVCPRGSIIYIVSTEKLANPGTNPIRTSSSVEELGQFVTERIGM